MDLKTLEQQDTGEFELKAPDGGKTGIVFILAGATHPAREALEKKQRAKGLRQLNRKGKAEVTEDPDELNELIVDRLVTCTLEWSGMTLDGKDYPFSKQAANDLYSNPRFGWIVTAVSGALNDTEVFMPPQSTN